MKCAEQDYIEIACLYKLPVRLCLHNESDIQGVAKDTFYNDKKQECIRLVSADGEKGVVLDSISSMQALKENPHFSLVNFSTN